MRVSRRLLVTATIAGVVSVLVSVGFHAATRLAAAAPAASASPAGARIVVEPASFDFGSLRPEKVVEKEFVLRNHGRSDLVVESLVSSCGCTAALTDAKVVKPGHSTPLRITLTAPDEPGKLEKSVLVKSNDPVQPTLEVKISAVVVGKPKER